MSEQPTRPMFTPVFQRAIPGQMPSASEQEKVILALKQLMGSGLPYRRLIGLEIIQIKAYDSGRNLYTGNVMYNSNPVHVHNAVSGEPSFVETSPAEEKQEIYDACDVITSVDCMVIAFYHAQSGYYIPISCYIAP